MKTPTPSWRVLALAVMLAPVLILRGEEFPTEPLTLSVDLNGDGLPEQVTRRKLGADDQLGTFYQVVVKDAQGAMLWKSPEVLAVDHPLAFGEWDFGISLPQFAADVDRDGQVELIVPAPQSDVSPTTFRMFRWNGSAFAPWQVKSLTGQGANWSGLSLDGQALAFVVLGGEMDRHQRGRRLGGEARDDAGGRRLDDRCRRACCEG
jgi:hypothetical protein